MISVRQLIHQLHVLGVREGGVLLVHTSFRQVRPVEDGPAGVLRALRAAVGKSGTVVMPTMTDGESVFDPRSTPTVNMGVVAETFWRQEGVLRSTHPGGSFAAVGPRAEEICAAQPLSPPHGPESPVGRVHALGGQVLLLGVGHDANTTLHLAETLAPVPYSVTHPCVVEVDGVATRQDIAETDHCCRGFAQADHWLRASDAQREGSVGHAQARLFESRTLVAEAVDRLRGDPLRFLCSPSEGCDECDLARLSVPR